MAVFTVGSLSCCNSTARPVQQCRHILGLYNHVVFFIQNTPIAFQLEICGRILSRT